MKRHISYAVIALMLAGTWGCGKREMGEIEGGKYPVQFSCKDFPKKGGAVSKVTDQNFEAGDVIGMYSYPSGEAMFGSGDFTRNNVPYVYQQEGELLVRDGEVPMYFPADPALPLTFKGYYPYSDQMTTDGVLSLDIADQSAGAKGAVLYSNNAQRIARTANYVRLEFGYVMAQVVINIQYDPETMPDGDVAAISAVTMEGDGMHTACDFHVTDGSVTTTGGSSVHGAIGMRPGTAKTIATVVPGTVFNLAVTVVTPTHTYVARPKNITYETGRSYTYNMTLKGGGEVQIGDARIMEWEPGNDPNNDGPIFGEPE